MQEAHPLCKGGMTVIVSACVPGCACAGQRTSFRSQFSPFPLQAPNGWTQSLKLSPFPVQSICWLIGSCLLTSASCQIVGMTGDVEWRGGKFEQPSLELRGWSPRTVCILERHFMSLYINSINFFIVLAGLLAPPMWWLIESTSKYHMRTIILKHFITFLVI